MRAHLGNAIRKCRIDLGIDVVLDVSDITPKKLGKPSAKHCAVGEIHYEAVDVDAPTGTIIYFKASLTGDESTDIKNYHTMHPTFPHESTGDQWFTESQFESYRQLGYHEVMTSMQGKEPEASPIRTATAANAVDGTVEPAVEKSATAAKAIRAVAAAMTAAAKIYDAEISGGGSDTDHIPKKKEASKEAPDERLMIALEKFGFDISRLTTS